jgi:hypothetical protein
MRYIVVILILILSTSAWAAPFLTCDVDTNCQWYEVYADGVLVTDNTPAPLWYDLETTPPAEISFTGKCCNYWECSEVNQDPFVSLKAPVPLLNLNVKAQK